MFFKSLILGAVCAFMAGGAVYYSTLPVTKTDVPFGNQSNAIPQTQNNQNKNSQVRIPQVQSSTSNNVDSETIAPSNAQSAPPKQAQYTYEPENPDAKGTEPKNTEPKESGPRRWLDQYLKRKVEPTSGTDESIDPSKAQPLAGDRVESEQSVAQQQYAYEDVSTHQNTVSQSSRERAVETNRMDVRDNAIVPDRKPSPYINETGNVDQNIQIGMREISKISAPTISEQAYFSLVSYALSHGRFNAAQEAMSRIMTMEMRETARINMAVALAKNGQSNEAFAMVNEIEAPEYRDILRLQVIEALLEHKDTNQGR